MRVDGKWLARYVLQGSPAQRAGILPGNELMSINGKRYRPLGLRAGEMATLVVSEDGKTRRKFRVRPEYQSMQQFFLDATQESERVERVQGHAVGYTHLWAGTSPPFVAALNDALTKFEQQHVPR